MSSENHIPEAGTAMQLWGQGQIACPVCSKNLQRENIVPLQMMPCPHCEKMFFVPKKIGQYFLYEPCGSGGMGSVYKAVSESYPDQVLAVKVLSRQARQSAANIHALLNEARVSALFSDSDFIVSCIDSGFSDDEYYAAMPFIAGDRLDKRLDRQGRLLEKNVLLMTLHILAAEQHIYRLGYLYRDLKPENIILNQYGYAVLLDFGLCITRDEAAHSEDEFISGSPYYIPPERLLGRGENASSEIYSLGMVMYHALTGKTFFDANEVEALARRHVSGLRINSTAKMKDLRSSIGILLDAMVRQEPKERPQDFSYVADSVKAILQEIG
ncbi:MAG: serine/threonine protein kinase [Oligosphaeraceae bacterium]|nr:serine/threonine protein kinase [Oligosphaeraceae bacterium]